MIERLMQRPWLFSFLVGTLAMVSCLTQISIMVPLLGEPYQPSMFINGVIGCYGIGSPVAFFLCKQAERLRRANDELQHAQAALSDAHDALAQKVRVDQMTGFLNREYFFEAFHSHHKPHDGNPIGNTLLIIDADHFKQINDRFGHLAGDAALGLITGTIKKALRNDDVIGRIGGEEFGVLLPQTGRDDALVVAERIRQTVEMLEFKPEDSSEIVPLTVSIGGVLTGTTAELSAAMGTADRNLYSAKNSGRNRVVISSDFALAA